MVNYSIIIPHYNSAQKCIRLIESIPRREDIKIIIIDDKSEKDEYLYLKSHLSKSENIVLKKNDTLKKGAGVARNIGLREKLGKWVLFADADDFFLEGAFENFDQYIEAKEEIVYFLVDSIYEDTKKPATRHVERNRILEKVIKKQENFESLKLLAPPWGKMIKSELIKKHNLKFEEVSAANDIYFSIKGNFLATDIGIVLKKVYMVTRDKNSITMIKSEENFNSRFSQWILINNFLENINKGYLRTSGIKYIFLARQYGIKKMYETYKLIKDSKNCIINISSLKKEIFNAIQSYKRNKKEKKYMSKKFNKIKRKIF